MESHYLLYPLTILEYYVDDDRKKTNFGLPEKRMRVAAAYVPMLSTKHPAAGLIARYAPNAAGMRTVPPAVLEQLRQIPFDFAFEVNPPKLTFSDELPKGIGSGKPILVDPDRFVGRGLAGEYVSRTLPKTDPQRLLVLEEAGGTDYSMFVILLLMSGVSLLVARRDVRKSARLAAQEAAERAERDEQMGTAADTETITAAAGAPEDERMARAFAVLSTPPPRKLSRSKHSQSRT